MCVIQIFVKIVQTVSEISRFFDFQDGRCPTSWIFKKFFFEHSLWFGGSLCVSVQNIVEIDVTVSEI